MSLRRHNRARLLGWDGPIFPSPTRKLATALNTGIDGSILEAVASEIEGFAVRLRESTSDGYEWFWMLEFVVAGGGRFRLAIPWATDEARRDNSPFDRSPAVYVSGEVERSNVDQILTDLIRRLGSRRKSP